MITLILEMNTGGPLICAVDGRAVLTGVVSWGMGCGKTGYPGIYANVFKVRDWISQTIRNNEQEFDYKDYEPSCGDEVAPMVIETTAKPTTPYVEPTERVLEKL